ncbi:amidoligase family protein [Actinoplanes sp. NPDC048796]|uniref:amidoligase family protein n=1 Tax=Actinoplanes sp. NPDC048796 TaxID=3155640 RepID=UPI003410DB18
MTAELRRRIGFEIELMAPRGASRRTLADDLAARHGGRVRPVWHSDSEPSLVPGLGRFLHLTQGFEVVRADGTLLCTLVDDITLLDGLNPRSPALPGWYRVLSDEPRLLRLLARQADPAAPLERVLDAAGELWGRTPEPIADVVRLDDETGATIALAAPQGAERERPCEIVTPPLARDHERALGELLGPARELGFTVPNEAAVHLHVDGAPFRRPSALANVVRLFAHWREPLRELLGTNPACRRLAPLPASLVAAADGVPGFDDLAKAAAEGGLTKYFDVNLTQLFADQPIRDTVEIRILPGMISTDEILNRAALVELLLDRCEDPEPLPVSAVPSVEDLLHFAAEALAAHR